ncbi:MAG TPA: flavin reductase family protein [Streptosporangiaceae bacterium]|nr:flavin reductase family protein [Streptosporangiaceae bacterium]
MFYEPAVQTSGLPHSPFTACCVPRPLGWISTVSIAGVHNLAPFANFQNVTFDPPTVLFSVCGSPDKDTLVNAVETGEFVWNMATYAQRGHVARSAVRYPPDVDEFEAAGIDYLPARVVRPRRVAASPVHFECRTQHTVKIQGNIPESMATIVIGQVIGIHIRDEVLTDDGRIDLLSIKPLARLGYLDYTTIDRLFEVEPELGGLFHNKEVNHGNGVKPSA